MKKILVATDFSERSDRALRRAMLLARQFEASVTLVHVVDDDQPRRIVDTERSEAEQLLRQMAATLKNIDDIESDTCVILGSPFAGIVDAAAEMLPDLLVIGPHRRQILRDIFTGTTAERIIRSVNCPVLMVNASPVGSYRHIMQTTDLSKASRGALERFLGLKLTAVRNTLLHVFDVPALRLAFSHTIPKDEKETLLAEENAEASREMSEFLQKADFGNVEPMIRHETTTTQHEILAVAEDEQADLIVVSTHGQTELARLFIGSVTEQVLRMSQVDVLAIPPSVAV